LVHRQRNEAAGKAQQISGIYGYPTFIVITKAGSYSSKLN
jgi:hypothetical protein